MLNIKGSVKDATAILPGTPIKVKGTHRQTHADGEGLYFIEAAPGETLVYSFMGFVSREIPIDSQRNIYITLTPDEDALAHSMVTLGG